MKLWSTFTALIFFLAAASPQVQAQKADLKQMERDMIASSGIDRVQKLIGLADAGIAAGRYKEALAWAEEAEGFARRLSAPEWGAMALNRQGKVHMAEQKNRRAVLAFSDSNRMLRGAGITNKNLTLDNLENMRKIALAANRLEEAQTLADQIEYVKNPGKHAPPGVESPGPPVPPTVEKPQNVSTETWEKQSKALEEQLQAKEDIIRKMSEEQVRNELLFMQQRRLYDSLSYKTRIDSMTISNRDLELRQAQSSRQLTFAIIGILLLLALGAGYSFLRARQNARVLEEKNKTIREEQQRSDKLLLNILPALVADELKKQGHTHARYFDNVSVLFADFVGFSKIAEKLKPEQLVGELDTCFKAFDDIVAKYGLEKIKTIGDAYMCAGGVPEGRGSQAADMVKAAQEMQDWLHKWNAERDKNKLPRFDARIGIHCGPVVAGVVGSKKFAFDIWGDTVNIASRIESAGEGGKINISGEVYQNIRNDFTCKYRGKIPAKNKGEIDMYFVEN